MKLFARWLLVSWAIFINCAPLYSRKTDTSWDWVGPIWSEDIKCHSCNYAGQNMVGVELSHGRLERGDFTAANLSLSHLKWTNFDHANFTQAALSGAQAKHTSFRHALFPFANLYNINAIEADFSHANLFKVDLTQVNLTKALLRYAEISFSNLSNSVFHMTDFTGAHLYRSLIYRSDLQDAILNKANLREAILYKTNLTGATLKNANLLFTQLVETNLTDADLTGANLTGANLTQAQLQNADLSEADFTSANLMNASLMGAKICGAKLNRAIFCLTTMPDGTIVNDHCIVLNELDSALQKVENENPAFTTAVGCKAFVNSLITPGSTKTDVTNFLKALQTNNPDQYVKFVNCSNVLKQAANRPKPKAHRPVPTKKLASDTLNQMNITNVNSGALATLPVSSTADHADTTAPKTTPTLTPLTPPAAAGCIKTGQSCAAETETSDCCNGGECIDGTCCATNGNT
ncbi:MAG TPA: pentapeptide repeat-containing protein, partial [Candidatus Babeliales bacterium]|nr:pentapeptide repeat-containing protein [Candidatus Babeliales bacterium]